MSSNSSTTLKYLNLDTLNATYNTVQTYNSYVFNTTSSTNAPNSYNVTFQLRNPIYNAKRIWLKSLEIPIGFSNIRSNNFSNTLTVATASSGSYNGFRNLGWEIERSGCCDL